MIFAHCGGGEGGWEVDGTILKEFAQCADDAKVIRVSGPLLN